MRPVHSRAIRRRWRHIRTLLALAMALAMAACMPVKPVAPQEQSAPAKPAQRPASPPAASTLPAQAPVAADTLIDSGAEVFDALAARLSQPVCQEGPAIRNWQRRYAGHPETFARQLQARLPLLAYVSQRVEEAGLPGEFALIPLVESGYNPSAIGPGGPAGLWQMIAGTARHYGVRVDAGYDGRLSPVDSTRAAVKLLSALQTKFGDWRTAAMAYNAGEYRLLRALRNASNASPSGTYTPPTGLPRTTTEYIVKLHALACLLAEPDRHGLILPRDAQFVPLQETAMPSPATLPAEPSTHPRRHIIVRGDTLSALAKRYGVPLSTLLRWNHLQANSLLKIGRPLRVSE